MKTRTAALVILLLIAGLLKAQEIGVTGIRLSTDNKEIENALGYGFYIFQPVWNFGAKISIAGFSGSRNYFGYPVSGFFSSPSEMIQENVRSYTSLDLFDVTIYLPRLFTIESINIGGEIGFARIGLRGVREGLDSGRRYDLYNENKFGYVYGGVLSYYNPFELPVTVRFSARHMFGEGTIYVTDTEAPYQGAISITQLQLSVGYLL